MTLIKYENMIKGWVISINGDKEENVTVQLQSWIGLEVFFGKYSRATCCLCEGLVMILTSLKDKRQVISSFYLPLRLRD